MTLISMVDVRAVFLLSAETEILDTSWMMDKLNVLMELLK